MTYKDNQPTFNVGNRKVVNFKDYLQNKDAEKAKLTKADLQSKPNSEDQQHLGNTRTEYNPVTHKLTDYSVDEIEDTLDDMEETNEGVFSDEGHAGMNGERYSEITPEEKEICLKVYRQYQSECLDSDGDYSMMFEDWLKRK
jgi:hypothetical protein